MSVLAVRNYVIWIENLFRFSHLGISYWGAWWAFGIWIESMKYQRKVKKWKVLLIGLLVSAGPLAGLSIFDHWGWCWSWLWGIYTYPIGHLICLQSSNPCLYLARSSTSFVQETYVLKYVYLIKISSTDPC